MKERKFKAIAITAALLFFAEITMAGSAGRSVRQGNRLYGEGDFNDAIKRYDQALIEQPQTLEPKFNKADCYFQLDDTEKAIELYKEVASGSKDMALVEKAKYNLGNSFFRQGLRQKDSDLQKSLEYLKESIVYWRNTLEINPKNEKAAKNIEVARLTIKDIIDQINKQKEQQQQQKEKQKQLAEQLKELAEQQKALAQKTQQTKKQADEGKIDRQEADNSYKQQAQQQSQLKDKTEQTMQQVQQQAASELEQAMNSQADAEEQLKNADGDTAKKAEDKAAEHIENALKQLSQPQDNQQNQAQQQTQQGQNQQPHEPNQPDEQKQQQKQQKQADTPDETAQEILDKEQKEKQQRRLLQQSGYQKVEKDW